MNVLELPRYDDWKTTPPDDPDPVATCDCCGSPLYEGDYLYTISGEELCEDCANDGYRRML